MSLYFETSFGSLNKTGEELCGDKVEIVKRERETILVLADGLGSGVKANILASLTSKIVSTMLAEGAEVQEVVETIAMTLPVCKERQIAYSTFTFLHINASGEGQIVEFDNPETVILRNGWPLSLERRELVFGEKKIREARVRLRAGDVCVLFSDGVVHAGVGKVLNLGWQHKNVVEYLVKNYERDLNAHAFQSKLLEACNQLYIEEPGDDTTVAVCRVRTPNVAYVMVGPPIDPADDEQIVKAFLEAPGTKVVCGGTTSRIVSRISGKQLKAVIDYISKDVPPVGAMEGIDLVTEGVITLGKVLEILKEYERDITRRDKLFAGKKDGASQLAQLLINQCTAVKFVVGRALNPAHQNPQLPFDLNLKFKLTTEIAECLKRLDKVVEVEYH